MMKEAPMFRISRLQKRKKELRGEMQAIQENIELIRNREHKYDMLNQQVVRITERIRKIREGRTTKEHIKDIITSQERLEKDIAKGEQS